MADTTKNYNLTKPNPEEFYDINQFNENMDKIDEALANKNQPMSMGGYKITNVAEPELRSDVATKGFVEDFSIEGSTYVAVDENNDGNVVLRPYVADEDSFGLGNAKKIAVSELDTTTAPGFYCINEAMTIDGYTANYWYLTISAYSTGNIQCTQTLEPIHSGDSYRLKRIVRKDKSQIGEWEWENPPMVENVDYRTIERWNSKTVYTRRIRFAATESNKTISLDLGTSNALIIRQFASNMHGALPQYNATAMLLADIRIHPYQHTIVYRDTRTDLEGNVWVQIWFTKD